jgi:hypothetical protein
MGRRVPVGSSDLVVAAPIEQDRWLEIGEYDEELARRWMAVMQNARENYRSDTAATLQSWICQRLSLGARTFYYEAAKFALAIRFDYVPKWRRYQVLSAGSTGEISAPDASNLLIDIAIEFLRSAPNQVPHQQVEKDYLIAVCPKQMDDPKMVILYDEVTRNPRVRATLVGESPIEKWWNIELLELVQG